MEKLVVKYYKSFSLLTVLIDFQLIMEVDYVCNLVFHSWETNILSKYFL